MPFTEIKRWEADLLPERPARFGMASAPGYWFSRIDPVFKRLLAVAGTAVLHLFILGLIKTGPSLSAAPSTTEHLTMVPTMDLGTAAKDEQAADDEAPQPRADIPAPALPVAAAEWSISKIMLPASVPAKTALAGQRAGGTRFDPYAGASPLKVDSSIAGSGGAHLALIAQWEAEIRSRVVRKGQTVHIRVRTDVNSKIDKVTFLGSLPDDVTQSTIRAILMNRTTPKVAAVFDLPPMELS